MQNSSLPRSAELLKTVGVAVLVLGLIAASFIYWSGEKHSGISSRDRETVALEGSWKDGTLAPEDLKGSSRTIEMNYGKTAVLIVNWLHQWAELKPHQLLAAAIVTVAALIAICCFLLAKRLPAERI